MLASLALARPFARNSSVDPNDTFKAKSAFKDLGLYEPPFGEVEFGLFPHALEGASAGSA